MTIELPISSLSNSIPFYNRLMGLKPYSLDYESAEYRFKDDHSILLKEGISNEPRVAQLVSADRNEFYETYRRLKHYLNKGNMLNCELLKDVIRVQDPDQHTWIITLTPLDETDLRLMAGNAQCYLEPFFN